MTKKQLEQLLEHGPFLRRLARKLLRDASRADDVVQEAWLVALRSDKSPSEVQRGWLAGIVRNLVRRERRNEERRSRRERVAARTVAVRSTGEMFDDEMARRRLAGLVLTLPEHYKTAILMRYYHGLAPLTIAERLGVTPSTVRTRLQRGLKRIREQLEVEHAGNRRALGWMLAAIVVGAGPRGAGAMLARGTAAAVLISALWVAFAPSSAEPQQRASDHPGRFVALAADAGTTDAAAGESALNDVRTPGAPQRAHVLPGRVILPAGVESKSVEIEVTAPGRTGVVRTVADGDFQVVVDPLFADGPPAALRVRATHPETDPCVLLVPVPWDEVVLRLQRRALVPEEELAPDRLEAEETTEPTALASLAEPAATAAAGTTTSYYGTATTSTTTRTAYVPLRGIVRIPAGVVPELASIHVSRGDQSVALRAAPDREFAFDVGTLLTGELPGSLQLVVSHPNTLPQRLDLPVFAGPSLDFVEINLEAADTLNGTVALEDGIAADGATVAAYPLFDGIPGEALAAATTTDSWGRFELAVPPGFEYYVVAAAPGWAPAGAHAVTGLELVLPHGVAIEGNVSGPSGPVADTQVGATRPEEGHLLRLATQTLSWTPAGVAWATTAAATDAEGRYRIGGLVAEVEYEVALGDDTRLVVAPGVADFTLDRVAVTITVLGAGTPVGGALVLADDAIATTGADGLATLALAPADSYSVHVSAEGYVSETRTITGGTGTFDLRPDTPRSTLVVSIQPYDPIAMPATCSFRLAPVDGTSAAIEKEVGLVAGRFILYDLEPGTYTIVAECGGYFMRAVAAVALRAGEASLLSLEPHAGGRLVVNAVGEFDEPVAVRVLFDLDPDSTPETGALVPPGRQLIWVEPLDPGYERKLLELNVVAGQTMHVGTRLTRVP